MSVAQENSSTDFKRFLDGMEVPGNVQIIEVRHGQFIYYFTSHPRTS